MDKTTQSISALMLLIVVLIGATAMADAQNSPDPDHTQFDQLLKRYVTAEGVAYRQWNETNSDVTRLSEYINTLEALDLGSLSRSQRLAYWINLYNAATLELVLTHYPVKSIKKIGSFLSSPWDRKVVTIAGEELSLNQIENEIIRPRFKDARIHFALNCASIGCPLLRAEVYTSAELDAQLDEACTLALNDRRWVDLSGKKLKLTKIFDWYRDDFVTDKSTVIDFIAQYRREPIPAEVKISHGDYDWSLNER